MGSVGAPEPVPDSERSDADEARTRRRLVSSLHRRAAALREHERVFAISVSTVLVMASQGVITPVLPLYARTFGVGASAIGLTLSVFAVARLLGNVPFGLLSDRFGRRLLLIGGPVVTSVGMLGSGLAGAFAELLAWRFVAGAGSAMYMTGAQIYLVDVSTPANRARTISVNHGALLVGVAVGPAIGGLLADLGGIRAPFYTVAVVTLCTAFYGWKRLPETRPATAADVATTGEGPRPRRSAFVLSRDFVAVALVAMTVYFTRTGSRMTLLPLLAVGTLGFSTSGVGLLFTAMAAVNIIGLVPAAALADRSGRKWAIVPSGIGVAVALVLIALAHSTPAFLIAVAVLATSTSIAGPAPAAYASDIAPDDQRGLAMAMFRTAGDVGFVVGPPLLGLVADAQSIRVALVVNAGLLVVAFLVFAAIAAETGGDRRARLPGEELLERGGPVDA